MACQIKITHDPGHIQDIRPDNHMTDSLWWISLVKRVFSLGLKFDSVCAVRAEAMSSKVGGRPLRKREYQEEYERVKELRQMRI